MKSCLLVASFLLFVVVVQGQQTCDSNSLLVKRDVKYLSSSTKQNLIEALKQMKNTPSAYNPNQNAYDYLVRSHVDVFDFKVHGYYLFAPWHRELINRLDSELRRVSGDPTMIFPYWDSTDEESTNAWFSDDFVGSRFGDADNDWIISGPLSTGFPVDPELSESSIPAETEHLTIARCAGNGQFTCLDTLSNSTVQIPYLLDTTSADRRIFESNTPIFGPFFSVTGDVAFWSVDKELNPCEWEDDRCLWYFRDESGGRYVCSHIAPVPPTKVSEQCLKEVFEYDDEIAGVGAPRRLFRPCLEGVDPTDAYTFPWATLGIAFLPPHGGAHTYIGGSLAQSGSPNDPTFFGIHGDVDRLWAEWQEDYNEEFTNSQLSTELPLFSGVTVSDVLNTEDLGWIYDTVLCEELAADTSEFFDTESNGSNSDDDDESFSPSEFDSSEDSSSEDSSSEDSSSSASIVSGSISLVLGLFFVFF